MFRGQEMEGRGKIVLVFIFPDLLTAAIVQFERIVKRKCLRGEGALEKRLLKMSSN